LNNGGLMPGKKELARRQAAVLILAVATKAAFLARATPCA
jgi:hypothetical protein